jgi:xylitol oxidase
MATGSVANPSLLTNWAANVHFRAADVHRPSRIEELQRIVRTSRQLRVVGTGHSFNDIADTTGDLVSLDQLIEPAEIDTASQIVKVSSRMTYGDLTAQLNRQGWALKNLGSLPHISVAGACATGTHGSGDANSILAAQVSAVDMVDARGEMVTVKRNEDGFWGSVLGLGSLGVVTSLTLDLVRAFDMRQDVYNTIPTDAFIDNLDRIFGSAYSVSAFTQWEADHITQVWLKQVVDTGTEVTAEEWFGGHRATAPQHPILGVPAENASIQLGSRAAWNQILPSFRAEFVPSSGDELQSEYFVGREHAAEAFTALRDVADRFAAPLLVSEIRTIAADELWLSPAYGRDSVGFHFTWRPDWPVVRTVLPIIESALAPFAPRAHWGKLFTADPATVRASHPRFDDFAERRRQADPAGKFTNDFVRRYFGSSPDPLLTR